MKAAHFDPIIQHQSWNPNTPVFHSTSSLPHHIMEKELGEMDLEEWEFLPDAAHLDFSHGNGKKALDQKRMVDEKYSIRPSLFSPRRLETLEDSGLPGDRNLVVLKVEDDLNQDMVKEIGEVPIVEIGEVPATAVTSKLAADQDMISQLFFKKVKGNEFDMKMDSPKSNNRAFKPQIEVGPILFEEKKESHEADCVEDQQPCKATVKGEEKRNKGMGSQIKGKGCWEGCSLTIWKWRVTGIGAFCSIGVAAAATICILILGGTQRHKQQHDQKLDFQICADDKSMNQVVHHATRLNQAISAARVPRARAQITFGGSFNGL